MGSDSREAELGRVLLDNVRNDSLRHALTPGLSRPANAPKHPTSGDLRPHEPVVNRLLHPIRNWNRPDVSALSDQVHDGPVVFASLKEINGQLGQFTTPKAAAQQDGQECSIALPFQRVGFRSLPETASFLSRQPVPQPDAQFLRPLTRRMPAASSGLSSPESAAS